MPSEELWSVLWEPCSRENAFVEALGDAAVRGELSDIPPSPDSTQALIERLAEFEPTLVERVVASLPLTSLDPHRASVFTREKKLWRGVGAIAAALGGSSGAMRELTPFVSKSCGADAAECECAGAALVLAAADALGGRGPGGRALPDHQRPSARHDALTTLLAEDATSEGWSVLRVLVSHDAAAAVRLLEQSSREAPFAGPLAKQNRLRVARALLALAPTLQDDAARTEVLEFITGQISSGALPSDPEVVRGAQELAALTRGERGDRAGLALVLHARPAPPALRAARALVAGRPRLLWRIDALLDRPDDAVQNFFLIEDPSDADVEEFLEYLRSRIEAGDDNLALDSRLRSLIDLRPRAAADLIPDRLLGSVAPVLRAEPTERTLEFADRLLETGRLAGDAAAAHLRALGVLRPSAAGAFLAANPGLVRPEEALAIVRETGASAAEAICLEAAGDPEGALDAILRRADGDDDDDGGCAAAALELCARAAPALPPAAAAQLWSRLLARARSASPALLLEAAAYVPAETLLQSAGALARGARALVTTAARRRLGWACTRRLAGREAHEALARALTAARRGTAVRGRCAGCGRRLDARPPVRATHCARARHVECGEEASCVACGRRVGEAAWVPPPRSARPRDDSPLDHALCLVAPPRPDLEGIA